MQTPDQQRVGSTAGRVEGLYTSGQLKIGAQPAVVRSPTRKLVTIPLEIEAGRIYDAGPQGPAPQGETHRLQRP